MVEIQARLPAAIRHLGIIVPLLHKMTCAMHVRSFIPVIIALLPVASLVAHAQERPGVCTGFFPFARNGTAQVDGHTSTGKPCQMGFGLRGGNVEALNINERPAHGVLGVSEIEANRRFIAYAPAAGFVGRDRFEFSVRIAPPNGGPSFTMRVIVDMTVTP